MASQIYWQLYLFESVPADVFIGVEANLLCESVKVWYQCTVLYEPIMLKYLLGIFLLDVTWAPYCPLICSVKGEISQTGQEKIELAIMFE